MTVSVGILALLAMGVSGVLFFNQIDFMYVLWPFSLPRFRLLELDIHKRNESAMMTSQPADLFLLAG